MTEGGHVVSARRDAGADMSEISARELRGFSAGLAWGLIFFALRVASRQNTFDSNIAMPVLYITLRRDIIR